MHQRNIVQRLLFVCVLLIAVACSTGDSQEATTNASEAPGASVAGRYCMAPPGYAEGPDQTVDADYYLTLNEDGTAQYEEQKIGGSETSVIARGTWEQADPGVIITLTELFGQPVENPDVLKYEYVDGFPVATEYAAGDQLYNVQQAEYSIGSGERHPLVNELHKRLAKIDYLNFADPGDDLYTEQTRKAVVAFQQART